MRELDPTVPGLAWNAGLRGPGPSDRPIGADKRRYRVLAVQTRTRDGLAIRRFLMMTGEYDVLTACNVGRALQILAKWEVDAIVVDESLSDGSGLDLARQVGAAGYAGAIIITADAMDQNRAADVAQLESATYAIRTPAWPAQLPDLLLRAIERARLIDENRALRARLREVEQRLQEALPRD